MDLDNKVILITGGTGSFGKKFTQKILSEYKLKKLIIFSRDEYKQYEMGKVFSTEKFPCIRYFLGDVRDRYRLIRAFENVDYVVHAAALKQVPALEYNPTEAVKTNVVGADNIVEAAIEAGVKKVVALSTDKAVSPINLYGATKLVAEKIFVAAGEYGGNRTKFSVVRYGNVVGSRGSVVPLLLSLKKQGKNEFPITDEEMTRFWMTLDQSVELVIRALRESIGGEIFIPRIPSMKIVDLAKAIIPGCGLRTVGIRPGEKLHETLISEDESRMARILDNIYVILPQFYVTKELSQIYDKCSSVPRGFSCASNNNEKWVTLDELQLMIKGLDYEDDPVFASTDR